MTKTEIATKQLTDLLNDALSGVNQEGGFKVESTNLNTNEFKVTFDIVEIDGEYTFIGY